MIPATFYQRVSAWMWDSCIFQILGIFLCPKFPVFDMTFITEKSVILYEHQLSTYLNKVMEMGFVLGLIYGVYIILIEWTWNTSLGKFCVGLSLEEFSNNDNARMKSFFCRYIGCLLSWLTGNVGHLLMLWRSDKKALQDIFSGISVIQDENVMLGTSPPLSPIVHKIFFYTGLSLPVWLIILGVIWNG